MHHPTPSPEQVPSVVAVALSGLASLGIDPLSLCCAAAGVFIVSANLPPSSTRVSALGRLMATILLATVFAAAIEQKFGGGPTLRAGLAGAVGLVFHTVLAALPDLVLGLIKRWFTAMTPPTQKD